MTISDDAERTSSTHILDLNDDCLIEVLSYLDVRDWISIASVCKRLKQIASILFAKNFKQMRICKDTIFSITGPFYKQKIALKDIDKILCEFGSLIVLLKTTPSVFGQAISSRMAIESIGKHCTEKLNSLQLAQFRINNKSLKHLQPVLNNLRELDLFECKLDSGTKFLFDKNSQITHFRFAYTNILNFDFLHQCTHIYSLSLVGIEMNGECLNRQFQNLKKIDLHSVSIQHKHIKSFFAKNPQLEFVSIAEDAGVVLVLIAKHLPNTKSLECNLERFDQTDDLGQVPKLNNVTCFKFYCERSTMSAPMSLLFSQNNSLRSLFLGYCRFDDQFYACAQILNHLKELTIFYCSGLNHTRIENILRNLTNLKNFTLFDHTLSIQDAYKFTREINRLDFLLVSGIEYDESVTVYEYYEYIKGIEKCVKTCELNILSVPDSKCSSMETELKTLETKSLKICFDNNRLKIKTKSNK